MTGTDDYQRGRHDAFLEAAEFLNTRDVHHNPHLPDYWLGILLEAFAGELEARAEECAPKLPKGAKTLPDGSIRLGVPRHYLAARRAAEAAYDAVKAKRAQGAP